MINIAIKRLLLSLPLLFIIDFCLPLAVYASEKLDNALGKEAMSQINSVSELRDVQPIEWAYEALQSLVERYGGIVGYPDSTYRGNRALTRWEFAAGLNACLNTIERLIGENVAVLKEDVDTLKRLAQEFETELAALEGRVDNLEGRVAYLEDHQFSTTPKLIRELAYTFPATDNLQITIGPRVNWYRYFDNNPYTFYLTGATSYNSNESTLLNAVDRGSGAVVAWNITEKLKLSAAYLAENTEFLSPAFGFNTFSHPDDGLFNSTYTISAELAYSPSDNTNQNLLFIKQTNIFSFFSYLLPQN